ncbi:MAG TPA: ribonuclease HII [Gemmatimonas aurantiaca]|uniref:Ribonuclease HII n=2 Tax=Gemmatimonas aurantiaca TaxID=173480 RepID=C1AAT1_GEMAT|nr:ribonuclease HII [Gemmatimonas aurantiaca]BAH39337.1 ribonuclease HII [Gemmatimonas aurantiaca T-27]HCT55966.1 ribonuclease HII [Gemmatimonas aurantiaca]
MARWSPIERTLRAQYGSLLVGVDEVGRGPLAGPVVACAIVMPADRRAIAGVDDSKRLDHRTRVTLAARIRDHALALSLGAASAREVDRLNIYHATVLAMQRALARIPQRLGAEPHHVVVDGKPLRTLGVVHTAVVKGDAKCYGIACASIVAKVTRDRLMTALAQRHGHYAWERNAGYGTTQHRDGISQHGLTAHHRRSFCLNVQTSLALDPVAPHGDELLLLPELSDD